MFNRKKNAELSPLRLKVGDLERSVKDKDARLTLGLNAIDLNLIVDALNRGCRLKLRKQEGPWAHYERWYQATLVDPNGVKAQASNTDPYRALADVTSKWRRYNEGHDGVEVP